MKIKYYLLLVLCTIAINVYAQEEDASKFLNIGDTAPPLIVQKWIKGNPIPQFEKGQVYILEFWATWCKPCIAAMPHLSELASTYKDKLTVIAVNVYEDENVSVQQVQDFVNQMGNRMNYHVIMDDNNQMVDNWIYNFDEKYHGIPRSFVIDGDGKVAWIGRPSDLNTVIKQVIDNEWDLEEARLKRNEKRYLDSLTSETSYLFTSIRYNSQNQTHEKIYDTPESILMLAEKIITEEPILEYTYFVIWNTFSALIQTDQTKAYEYAKKVVAIPSYITRFSPYSAVISVIRNSVDTLDIQPEMFLVGAEAYEKEIDETIYPEIVNIPKDYANVANWYWLGKDTAKAIDAQQKAIDALKNRSGFSESELMKLENTLKKYKGI